MQGAPVRVVLADDDPSVLSALSDLVSSTHGLELIGCAMSGVETIAAVAASCPDVLVLDARMPGGGVVLVDRLLRACPDVAIVVLTAHPDGAAARAMLAGGAKEIVAKGGSVESLSAVLRRVCGST